MAIVRPAQSGGGFVPMTWHREVLGLNGETLRTLTCEEDLPEEPGPIDHVVIQVCDCLIPRLRQRG
jgi:hypothetical protein